MGEHSLCLLLRVFAECPPGTHTAPLAASLLGALATFEARAEGLPESYWKIPEWTEFTFRLSQPSGARFEAFLASHPSGWSHAGDGDERSSVWNPPGPFAPEASPDAMQSRHFLDPRVRWAELILTPDITL